MAASNSTPTPLCLPASSTCIAVRKAINAACRRNYEEQIFSFDVVDSIIKARKLLDEHGHALMHCRRDIAQVAYQCVQAPQFVYFSLSHLQFEYSDKGAELISLMSGICEKIQESHKDGWNALAMCGLVCFHELCEHAKKEGMYPDTDSDSSDESDAESTTSSLDAECSDGCDSDTTIIIPDVAAPDALPVKRSKGLAPLSRSNAKPPVIQTRFKGGRGGGRAPTRKVLLRNQREKASASLPNK
jgi:hypothetical protein